MSQFVTLMPTPLAQEVDDELPGAPWWVQWLLGILACAPLVFVILYWVGKLRCEKVVAYSVGTSAAFFAIWVATLFYLKRLPWMQSAQSTDVATDP